MVNWTVRWSGSMAGREYGRRYDAHAALRERRIRRHLRAALFCFLCFGDNQTFRDTG